MGKTYGCHGGAWSAAHGQPGFRAKTRRLGRTERREQILDATARALVTRGGFAGTNPDDVAAEAGVTRMILYRHFESRNELYRAVLDRAGSRLYEATTAGGQDDRRSSPSLAGAVSRG